MHQPTVDTQTMKRSIFVYDNGVKDDLLKLLYKVNIDMKILVNTPYGLTEPSLIPAPVAEGDILPLGGSRSGRSRADLYTIFHFYLS